MHSSCDWKFKNENKTSRSANCRGSCNHSSIYTDTLKTEAQQRRRKIAEEIVISKRPLTAASSSRYLEDHGSSNDSFIYHTYRNTRDVNITTARNIIALRSDLRTVENYEKRWQFQQEHEDYDKFRNNRGIKNIGNTCYMNSSLQILLHTYPLMDLFQHYNLHCKNIITNADLQEGTITEAFLNLIMDYFDSDYALPNSSNIKSIDPKPFKTLMDKKSHVFHGHKQHDAHEFLCVFFDLLQKEEEYSMEKMKITDYERVRKRNDDTNDENHMITKIAKIFCGKLVSKLECTACHKIRSCSNEFYDLSIPIAHQPFYSSPVKEREKNSEANIMSNTMNRLSFRIKTEEKKNERSRTYQSDKSTNATTTLEQCLQNFFREEILEEKIMCGRCRKCTEHTKTLQISKFPTVLIIHFKRFDSATSSSRSCKLNTPVYFPLENLNLSNFAGVEEKTASLLSRGYGHDSFCENNGLVLYDCYAICNHTGSSNYGHYTANCLDAKRQRWYNFDDEKVGKLENETHPSDYDSPYILFYKRK